jgi:regulatory protein
MEQKWTHGVAKEKIRHFCAYSERCHSEVRTKLFSHGLNSREVEELISGLIEENYLNEERFAKQYAGGHFRLKQWGKVKIVYALRAKKISEPCIKRGLAEIDPAAYDSLLTKLAMQKWKTLKGQLPAVKWSKTRQFLLQRGFEPSLVLDVLKKLEKNQ